MPRKIAAEPEAPVEPPAAPTVPVLTSYRLFVYQHPWEPVLDEEGKQLIAGRDPSWLPLNLDAPYQAADKDAALGAALEMAKARARSGERDTSPGEDADTTVIEITVAVVSERNWNPATATTELREVTTWQDGRVR